MEIPFGNYYLLQTEDHLVAVNRNNLNKYLCYDYGKDDFKSVYIKSIEMCLNLFEK